MKIPGIKELILKSIKQDRYEKYLEHVPNFKSEKNEKLITIILTITASIILGIFALNPTLSTIVSLQKQIYETNLQEKINNLATLEQKYQKMKGDLPTVFAAVPKTAEIATLAATLQTIVSSTSAKLINLQTLQVELSKQILSGKKYSSYGFDLTAQGEYKDLLMILEKLINFQRIVTINNISIVKSVSTTETTLQINVSGNAYFKQ